jgi:hypothetical protein
VQVGQSATATGHGVAPAHAAESGQRQIGAQQVDAWRALRLLERLDAIAGLNDVKGSCASIGGLKGGARRVRSATISP